MECSLKYLSEFVEGSVIRKYESIRKKQAMTSKNIYHYTDINALKEILKTQKFWFTRWNYLNDMTEIDYAIRIIQNLMPKICVDIPDERTEVIIRVIKSLMTKVYLMSFSTTKDSITMWGNYSSNFQGYNIGTDSIIINHLINKNKLFVLNNVESEKYYLDNEIISGNVIYNEKEQFEIIDNLLKCLNELYKKFKNSCESDGEAISEEFDNVEMLIIENMIYYCALFKKPGFAPEEEFRFVIRLNNDIDEAKFIRFKTANGVFIPYIRVGIDFNDSNNESIIKLIGIGPKNKMDIAVEGLSSYLRFLGYEITDESKIQYNTLNKKVAIFKSGIPLRY